MGKVWVKFFKPLWLLIDLRLAAAFIIASQLAVLWYLLAVADLDYQKFQNVFVLACFFMTVFSCIFGFFGLCAIIKVIAFENATHDIEYVPLDPKDIDRENKTDWTKLEKEMAKPHSEILEDNFIPDDIMED
ncbi:MAG: hypothetical protein KAJ40_00580 [Alphaproteobacteria bacterium]|nr:hypothetical protein [Alphaproteobacteria bacterium]